MQRDENNPKNHENNIKRCENNSKKHDIILVPYAGLKGQLSGARDE